jgi:F420H(2)-dependent quinone reductase
LSPDRRERLPGLPSSGPSTYPGIVKRQEVDMADTLDWNAKTIAEFRANQGRLGGNFKGAPVVLLHHRGRKSGREYVTIGRRRTRQTGRQAASTMLELEGAQALSSVR